MSRHLSEAELVDWVEGLADRGAREHVSTCGACRDRADAYRGTLGLAAETDIPEPSPDYWETFRRQVDHRIARDAVRPTSLPRWLVPSLAGLAAAVGVAVLLRAPLPASAPRPVADASLPAWSALPEPEDVGLDLIQALAPSAEDAASESCRVAYDCLAALSDDETAAVAETLERDLDGRSL